MMRHNRGYHRGRKQVKKSTLLMEIAEDIMDIVIKARKYKKLRHRNEID